MKPNRRKAVVSDPIKRIGLNGSNSAREIVIQIARALGFKIHEDDKGVSAYGGNAIRIADHCTYMQTWVDNGTWNAPIRLDVVIEDEPTEAVTQVRIGYDFGITEFVSQSNDIDPQNARMIAYDIRNTMNGNPYANNVRGERRNLVATHGNNPQELNCNTNMNKKLIRLTESDLHRIVKESVNKILSEAINELDPRTYASYADKRRAQGQNDKAFKGTQAAANAWNKEYGYNNNSNGRKSSMGMDDYGYNNTDDLGAYEYDFDNGLQYKINHHNYDPLVGHSVNTYRPYKDEYQDIRSGTPKDSFFPKVPGSVERGKGEGTLGVYADTDVDLGLNNRRKGLDVAKQMARGNGKYIQVSQVPNLPVLIDRFQ